jgi:hypothetical protein
MGAQDHTEAPAQDSEGKICARGFSSFLTNDKNLFNWLQLKLICSVTWLTKQNGLLQDKLALDNVVIRRVSKRLGPMCSQRRRRGETEQPCAHGAMRTRVVRISIFRLVSRYSYFEFFFSWYIRRLRLWNNIWDFCTSLVWISETYMKRTLVSIIQNLRLNTKAVCGTGRLLH